MSMIRIINNQTNSSLGAEIWCGDSPTIMRSLGLFAVFVLLLFVYLFVCLFVCLFLFSNHKPCLHGGSNPDSTRIRFTCEWYQPGFQSG